MTTISEHTEPEARAVDCWCCGEERAEDDVARLNCHDEVALCAGCIEWLGERRPGRASVALRRGIPILATSDIGRALQHYEALGFETEAFEGGGYGFARRDRVELHFGEFDVDPKTNTACCYVHVEDADALHAEWSAAGLEGRFVAPVDTDYGLREGAHVDPDGNLIRYGSPLGD